MLFDDNGVPYTLGDSGLQYSGGVRVEDFHPPTLFEIPESIYARTDEVKSGAATHYGNVLSHHAQQLLALKYLSDNAGFDPVVWCRVHFTKNLSIMVLNVVENVWREIREVQE